VNNETQRAFIPGDEWLYYKLYTGPKTSETILSEVIKPTCEKLLKKNLVDKWFFIRYNDPEYHLRVRFHCTKLEHIATVIHELRPQLKWFFQNDLIHKIQLATYERELERYGFETIESFEELFFLDSLIIVDYLATSVNEDLGDDRWLFGCMGIDCILNLFTFDLKDKLILIEELKIDFGKEFGLNRALKKQLNEKFMKNHELIHETLFNLKKNSQENPNIKNILESYILSAKKNIKYIMLNTHDNFLNDRIKSYLHMFLNRLFRSKNRLQEFVLYYMLHKYYLSQKNFQKFGH